MAVIGRIELEVTATTIDLNGHVNNVQYVQWMQDAAVAHSAELGWPQERYSAIGRTWVIRSHTIEYQHSAYLGDTIVGLTWVADFRKFRSLRKYKFIRSSDETVLATAETLFIFCDLLTGKPMTIPLEVRDAFTVVDQASEP
jgi:Predicted thioesterase